MGSSAPPDPLAEIDIPWCIRTARDGVARKARDFLCPDLGIFGSHAREIPPELLTYLCGKDGEIDKLGKAFRHFVGSAAQINENFCAAGRNTCTHVSPRHLFQGLIELNTSIFLLYSGLGSFSTTEAKQTQERQVALRAFIMGEGSLDFETTVTFSARMFAWRNLLVNLGYTVPDVLTDILHHGVPELRTDPVIGANSLMHQLYQLVCLTWGTSTLAKERTGQLKAMVRFHGTLHMAAQRPQRERDQPSPLVRISALVA